MSNKTKILTEGQIKKVRAIKLRESKFQKTLQTEAMTLGQAFMKGMKRMFRGKGSKSNQQVIAVIADYYGGEYGKFIKKEMPYRFKGYDLKEIFDTFIENPKTEKNYRIMFEVLAVSYFDYFVYKTFSYSSRLRKLLNMKKEVSTGNMQLDELIGMSVAQAFGTGKVVADVMKKSKARLTAHFEEVTEFPEFKQLFGLDSKDGKDNEKKKGGKGKTDDDGHVNVDSIKKESLEAKRITEGIVDFFAKLFDRPRVMSAMDLAKVIVDNIELSGNMKKYLLKYTMNRNDLEIDTFKITPESVSKLLTKPAIKFMVEISLKKHMDKIAKLRALNYLMFRILTQTKILDTVEKVVARNILSVVPKLKDMIDAVRSKEKPRVKLK